LLFRLELVKMEVAAVGAAAAGGVSECRAGAVREKAVLLPDATALKRTVLVLHKAVAWEVELT
jgi:hypothetical protein